MTTGMMVNLINTLIQSFEMMMGLAQRAPWRPNKGVPRLVDDGIAEYLPPGSLRSIWLSNRGGNRSSENKEQATRSGPYLSHRLGIVVRL